MLLNIQVISSMVRIRTANQETDADADADGRIDGQTDTASRQSLFRDASVLFYKSADVSLK